MTPSEKPAPKMRCAASTSSAPSPTERLKKEWWAHDHGDVVRVTGYSCAPANPEVWWCPGIGYSCSEGHHLFETEAEALRSALIYAESEATKLAGIVKRLNSRMSNSGAIEPQEDAT